jgi:4-oxalocrotonate tautomerase
MYLASDKGLEYNEIDAHRNAQGQCSQTKRRQSQMPTILVDGPPISVEQKRELVKRLTEVAVKVYRIEHITVLVRENPPENVGVNGQLLADRRKPS